MDEVNFHFECMQYDDCCEISNELLRQFIPDIPGIGLRVCADDCSHNAFSPYTTVFPRYYYDEFESDVMYTYEAEMFDIRCPDRYDYVEWLRDVLVYVDEDGRIEALIESISEQDRTRTTEAKILETNFYDWRASWKKRGCPILVRKDRVSRYVKGNLVTRSMQYPFDENLKTAKE